MPVFCIVVTMLAAVPVNDHSEAMLVLDGLDQNTGRAACMEGIDLAAWQERTRHTQGSHSLYAPVSFISHKTFHTHCAWQPCTAFVRLHTDRSGQPSQVHGEDLLRFLSLSQPNALDSWVSRSPWHMD